MDCFTANLEVERVKVCIVGDVGVGKTAMLISYTKNSFPSGYIPTVFESRMVTHVVNGKPYDMALWETVAQGDYARLRPYSYTDTDIFMVCFDIGNRSSLTNISDKWIHEISHYRPATPRILVGCKSDLRSTTSEERCVSVKEAKRLAQECKLVQYMETSALELKGLDVLFDEATKAAALGIKRAKAKRSFFNVKRKSIEGPLVVKLPPIMPPAGLAPEIKIEPCTKGEQWLRMLHEDICTDLTLVLASGQKVKAHATILASASSVFRKALNIESRTNNYKNVVDTIIKFSHPAILNVDTSDLSSTQISFTDLVKPQVLNHALEFFYSGVVIFKEAPSDELLELLREFSDMFSVPYLKQICDNVDNDEEELNRSIGAHLCDITGERLKEYFFDSSKKADVKFIFEEKEVFAHKCLLSARNKVMATMFDGRFMEGSSEEIAMIDMRNDRDTDPVTFLVMLEYLYTGNTTLDQGVDPAALLILCDRYNVTRLTSICVQHITKLVEQKCYNNIEKADMDVIGLLNLAHMYNASQLVKWCLHFISSNYLAFSRRPEWNQLSTGDLQHIEEDRRPPIDYLNEVREYQAAEKEAKEGSGCSVM